ncbi:MAG: fumarate hydratase C-terminal domain-containing protein, partial [Candidatus Altiarchaeota archaeon]
MQEEDSGGGGLKLKTPLSEGEVRKLKVGNEVELSGVIVTARDTAHKYLTQKNPKLPLSLEGLVLYHCGPIVEGRSVIAAGPTTSIREEPYEAEVIRRYGIRGIIGKGGMGDRTLDALKRYGAVYLSAVGGAAAVMASSIEKTIDVYMLEEFGVPEAFWIL